VTAESAEELYEHAPCGYLSAEISGGIVRVNQTFLDWTGYTREQLLGRSFDSLLSVGSRLFFETRFLPILRLEGEIREAALSVRRADDTVLPVLVNSILVRDDAGSPVSVRTAVFDSTKRQDYERDLLLARRASEQSEARVRVLQEASGRFGSSTSEEALAEALVSTMHDAFDARAAAVLLLEGNGDLRLRAGVHPIGMSLPRSDSGPETEALRSGMPVVVTSVDEAERKYPALARAMLDAHLEALTVAPLIQGTTPLGVVVAFFGRQRTFDSGALDLQSALGRQAAQVLQWLRLQDQLRHDAFHDSLTGLANRNLLRTRLGDVVLGARQRKTSVALVFVDLDGFKPINDTLGHAAGDQVLAEISERLREVVRREDTVGRLGGDEFVVLCEDADEATALLIAERIRESIRQPFPGVADGFLVTASIGVAVHSPESSRSMTGEGLLHEADEAMYRSKTEGKDRVTVVAV
jgi:diguanylate cyclase (GGDEF)-like protein/PAS domain S-box-containing protein